MEKVIMLDSSPVGLITNPKANSLAKDCQQWFYTLLQRKYKVILPEIVDYEIRRELLRANKLSGLRRLDQLKSEILYLPITTEIMLQQFSIKLTTRAIHQIKSRQSFTVLHTYTFDCNLL